MGYTVFNNFNLLEEKINVSGTSENFWANAKRGLREREIADILRVIDKWRPFLDIPEDTPGILWPTTPISRRAMTPRS